MIKQGKNNKCIKVFSARACAEPLEKAAKLFEEMTGIKVVISVCSRHCAQPIAEEAHDMGRGEDFLDEIADAKIHDLAIGGAEYLLDDGEGRGIIQRGKRRTIAYRKSAIIIPPDNPGGIRNLEDLTKSGVRVGVSVIDCLKGIWEDICGRQGMIEAVRNNITFYAHGCIAIIEAVAERKVDAAFGWTTFEHLAPGKIKVIPLPEDQFICRGTCIGLLKFSSEPKAAEHFMEFLTTKDARTRYLEFGWIVPDRAVSGPVPVHSIPT